MQIANYLLPLALVPYLVRVLGPAHYGSLGFSVATVQYFVLLTDYGFNLSATREIAAMSSDKTGVSRLFWSVTACKTTLALVGLAILGTLIWLVPYFWENRVVLLLSYLMVVGNILFPIWLFQGLQNMQVIMICGVLSRFLVLPLTFVFVHSPDDTWVAAATQSGANVVCGLMGIGFIAHSRIISWIRPSISDLKRTYSDGWHVFLATAAVNLYTTSNTVILGLVCGNYAVGQFVAVDKIRQAVQNLLATISQAAFPHSSALMSSDREKGLRFVKKLLIFQPALTFVISLSLFVLAEPIVSIALGKNFMGAVWTLRVLAFIPFAVSFSNVFGIQTMLPLRMHKPFTAILIGAGMTNLVAVTLLSSWASHFGTALSQLLMETLISVAMAVYLVLHRIPIFEWKGLVKCRTTP
jgi:O-antigen/teichoic acid export membrane protein